MPIWGDIPLYHEKKKRVGSMHQPGIEPGPNPWQGSIVAI